RERQREAARHLLLAGRSAEPALEQARDTLDGAGLLAHAARNPIEPAELVEDGAADTKSRVGREQRLARRVEAVERVEKAECAPRDHVVEIGMRCRSPADTSRPPPHERQVPADDDLALADRRRQPALLHAVFPPRADRVRGAYPTEHECRERKLEPRPSATR